MSMRSKLCLGCYGRLAALVATLLLGTGAAFAQSCALCYTQAAQATARFIEALRSGILILMVPPMFMCIGFTLMAYRKRNRYKDEISEGNGGW